MQPSPRAETSRPLVPSVRCSIASPRFSSPSVAPIIGARPKKRGAGRPPSQVRRERPAPSVLLPAYFSPWLVAVGGTAAAVGWVVTSTGGGVGAGDLRGRPVRGFRGCRPNSCRRGLRGPWMGCGPRRRWGNGRGYRRVANSTHCAALLLLV